MTGTADPGQRRLVVALAVVLAATAIAVAYTVTGSDDTSSTSVPATSMPATTVLTTAAPPAITAAVVTTLPPVVATTVPAIATLPPSTDVSTTAAPIDTTPPLVASDAAQAALSIVDMLLLDCGYDITEWTDGGPEGTGWVWIATTLAGPATFVVDDPLGAFWVDVRDQAAADLAIECGFYSP